jgi:hypothetical protein
MYVMFTLLAETIRRYGTTVSMVFPFSGFPAYTYAPRLLEEERYARAMRMPGLSILVLGPSCCGKSSFIKNQSLRRARKPAWYLWLCRGRKPAWYLCDENSKFPYIVNDLLRNTVSRSRAESIILKSFFMPVDQQEPYVQQRLLELLVARKKSIVLEDIHKLPQRQRRLVVLLLKQAAAMNVKVILSATAFGARELGFAEAIRHNNLQVIHLSHLRNTQKYILIRKSEQALNIVFSKVLKRKIVEECPTAGECHRVCFNMCEELNVRKWQRKPRYIYSINQIIMMR